MDHRLKNDRNSCTSCTRLYTAAINSQQTFVSLLAFEHTIIKLICPGTNFVSIRNSFCPKLRIHSKKIGLFHKCAIISKFRAIFTRNIKKFFRAKISVETPTPK